MWEYPVTSTADSYFFSFLSVTSFKYKVGFIKTLIDRAFKIDNTRDGFQNYLNDLTLTYKRNSFLAHVSHVIDNTVKQYLKKNSNTINGSSNALSQNNSINFRYFKLPYIGNFSKLADIKFKTLVCKNLCSDFKIKLVFSSFKIKNFFTFKDPIPDVLKSYVVYEFTCEGCNSRYIGESTHHFSTRIKEHNSDKNSDIFKHLKQSKTGRD